MSGHIRAQCFGGRLRSWPDLGPDIGSGSGQRGGYIVALCFLRRTPDRGWICVMGPGSMHWDA
eukprot:6835700-Pyramimonas_sp.AAC.1